MGCPQVLEKNLHVGHWNTNIQRIWTVQHEAEEFQSTTGCLCHTDGLCIPECFNSYIQCLYIYIRTSASIPSIFNLTLTLQLHKLQTSSIHYLTSHWPLQPSNSRSPLLTELLEDNARLRWRPFRSCRVLEKTGQSRVMWPIICCFVGEISVV